MLLLALMVGVMAADRADVDHHSSYICDLLYYGKELINV